MVANHYGADEAPSEGAWVDSGKQEPFPQPVEGPRRSPAVSCEAAEDQQPCTSPY
jgi:hypothetical protein